MATLAEVAVRVIPQTDKFEPDLKNKLRRIDASKEGRQVGARFGSGMHTSIASSVRRSAGLLIGGFAAIKAVQVFGGFIADAQESAKVSRITANAIRATGGAAKVSADQVGALATAISNKSGIDDEAIQTGQNLLLTFKNVRNEAGAGNDIFNRASQAVADLSIQFGGIDGAAKQMGKALNDPVKGTTALAKAGVTFTQQQKDQIKTLVASGHTLDAQRIILKEVESQVGGAAAAAADPMTRLRVIAGNLGEDFGTLLLPTISRLADVLTAKAVPAVQGFLAGLKGQGLIDGFSGALNTLGLGVRAVVLAFQDGDVTSDGFVGGMERVGVAARAAFDYFKSNVLPLLEQFGSFLVGTVIPAVADFADFLVRNRTVVFSLAAAFGALVAIGRIQVAVLALQQVGLIGYLSATKTARVLTLAWSGAQWLLNAALTANPIGLVVVGIGLLIGAIVLAWKRSETFRDVIKAVWEGVKAAFQAGIRFVANIYLGMVSMILTGAAKAFGWIPGIGPKLKAAAKAFDKFRDDVNVSLGGIKDKSVVIRAKVNDVAATLVHAGVSRAEALNIANRELKGRTYFGGPIRHGIRSKDSALFLARRDEHVWTPEEVDAAGGHAGVYRLRAMAKAGQLRGAVRGFAAGGAVNFDVRAATLTGAQLTRALRPVERSLATVVEGIGLVASRGVSRIAGRMLAASAAFGAGGPPPQAGDYSRLTWRGAQLDARTVRMVLAAEKLLGGIFRITQGSWSTRVAASRGTHAGGGVLDVNSDGTSWASAVRALRRVGFAAWHRSPSQGPWGHHIHAVAIGDRLLSPAAANQVRSFRSGGDGLGGRDRIFDKGGYLLPGMAGINGGRRPERVLSDRQTESFDRLVALLEKGRTGAAETHFHATINHVPGYSTPRDLEEARRAMSLRRNLGWAH